MGRNGHRMRQKWLIATAALVAASVPCVAATPVRADAPTTCIGSGTEADIDAVLVGPGAHALLCQGAVFRLQAPVVLDAPGQTISTVGDPVGAGRARLEIADPDLSVALQFTNQSDVEVGYLEVDGRRRTLGFEPTPSDGGTGDALVQGGGASTGQVVEHVRIRDARSWSAFHVTEGPGPSGCSHASVHDDVIIGPAAARYEWSDGISFACSASEVVDNTVTDASDGGIVVFGAPGTLVARNTVLAQHQEALGGINLVDRQPYDGDYTGTVVRDNTVRSDGAPMHIGIAQGWGAWFCADEPHEYVTSELHGASVLDNHLGGAQLIYGMVVSGVRDWTVTGNDVEPNRIAQAATTGCESKVADPTALLIQSARAKGTFQPGFANGHTHGALFAVTTWAHPVPTTDDAAPPTTTTTLARQTTTAAATSSQQASPAVPVPGLAAFTG